MITNTCLQKQGSKETLCSSKNASRNSSQKSIQMDEKKSQQNMRESAKSEQSNTSTQNNPSYQEKRFFIFLWLRKFCASFKVSKDAAAMAQMLADRYYALVPYEKEKAKKTLAVIIMIASKFTDLKVIVPRNLKSIFQFDISEIDALEEDILCVIDFDLTFINYSHELNRYLAKYCQLTYPQFFTGTEKQLHKLNQANWIVENIYYRFRQVTESHYRLAIQTVTDREYDHETLDKIFKSKVSAQLIQQLGQQYVAELPKDYNSTNKQQIINRYIYTEAK